MKIEIQKSNDDPANTLMECYSIGGIRPFCKIEENDFIEILTDAQLKKFQNGDFKFAVKAELLIEKCKQLF